MTDFYVTHADDPSFTFSGNQPTGGSEDRFGKRRYFLEGRETTDPEDIKRIDDLLANDPYGRDCKV